MMTQRSAWAATTGERSQAWELPPRVVRALAFVVLALCVLYVAFALTPSSYSQAFAYLGLPAQEPLLGTARHFRSDEWMVFTPYVQIAVANDFGAINAHSPYHETLRSFQALPLLDWGMLFKPYHWAFLVLPPANAYAFFFMFMAMAFLGGWALFLRQLRFPPLAAVLVSATLFFSPFVQVWWTSNAGAFALAPWAAVAWMQIGTRWLRLAASTYALVVWLLAVAYPPFILASLIAMAILTLAFRRDLLTWTRLAEAAIAGAVAAALFFAYFHELIEIVRNTVYPGSRVNGGGDVGIITLLAHWMPNLMTYRFEPLPAFQPSNACEIAVLSSLLPLFTLALVDRAGLRRWVAAQARPLLIFAVGVLLLACWLFLPVPVSIARITGLSMMPPTRALLALGLLLNILCAMALLHSGVRITRARLLMLTAALFAGSLVKFAFGAGSFSRLHSAYDAIPYLCVGLLAIAARRPRLLPHAATVVLAVACVGNLLANGLFNPVQSARPIFAMDRTAIAESMASRGARSTADGTLVVDGHYGALLSGVGIPAVNHVLYHPQLAFFRDYFPTMPDGAFNEAFNRYAHISVGHRDAPLAVQTDMVEVPAAAMLAGPVPGDAPVAAGRSIAPARPCADADAADVATCPPAAEHP